MRYVAEYAFWWLFCSLQDDEKWPIYLKPFSTGPSTKYTHTHPHKYTHTHTDDGNRREWIAWHFAWNCSWIFGDFVGDFYKLVFDHLSFLKLDLGWFVEWSTGMNLGTSNQSVTNKHCLDAILIVVIFIEDIATNDWISQ